MPGIKISDLPLETELLPADEVLITRGNTSRKVLASSIARTNDISYWTNEIIALSTQTINVVDGPSIDLSYNATTRTLSADISVVPLSKGGTGHTNFLQNALLVGDGTGTLEQRQLSAADGISFLKIDTPEDKFFVFANTAPHVATNLSHSVNSNSITLQSSTGNTTTLQAATNNLAGVMTAADRQQVNEVLSAESRYFLPGDPNNTIIGKNKIVKRDQNGSSAFGQVRIEYSSAGLIGNYATLDHNGLRLDGNAANDQTTSANQIVFGNQSETWDEEDKNRIISNGQRFTFPAVGGEFITSSQVEQGGAVGQNISNYTEALSSTVALRSEDGDTLFRWVNATSTGGFNAWRDSAEQQENGNTLTWQGLTLGSFDTSYLNNYFDGNSISFVDGYRPATTTYEGTQSKIRVATITDPAGYGSPTGAIVRDFTFPTTGGEFVTDTNLNLYKTNVASATAKALQTLSYNNAGTLSISDGNNVTLSAFSNLTVAGSVSANGLYTSFNQGSATGSYSFAEGRGKAFGQYSHAEGAQTTASGNSSHAEGWLSLAAGPYSHTEGYGAYTTSTGTAGHAEGTLTVVSGEAGHAEGSLSEAKGNSSHAAGFRATAAQDYTYAWADGNSGTLTQNVSTTRTGQYMVSASGGVFIPGNVGIGTDDNSRALTVKGNTNVTNGQILSAGTDLFDIFGQVGTLDEQMSLTSTNAVQNSAITTALNLLAPAPTYVSPTALITNFPSSQLELGTSISQSITLSWTQNDAGSQTSQWIVNKNGSLLTSGFSPLPQATSINEAVALGTTTYQLSVNHLQGILKNNILNLPDSRGRINAGSVTTSQSYTGYYKYFYGSVATVPSDLRTLPSSVLGTGAGNSIPSFTANQVNMVIVIPATKVLQSVITQTLEDITNNFTQTAVTVNDAGGTGRSYRSYVATTVTPLNIPLTTITLANA